MSQKRKFYSPSANYVSSPPLNAPLSLSKEYDQPHESQTNKDILETINRKGLNSFGPDSPEGDDYHIPEHDSPPRNNETAAAPGHAGSPHPSSTVPATASHETNDFHTLLNNRNHNLIANNGEMRTILFL